MNLTIEMLQRYRFFGIFRNPLPNLLGYEDSVSQLSSLVLQQC
jgi:hypothetical protein